MPNPTPTTAPQGKPEGEPRLVLPPTAPLMAIDPEFLNRASAPRGFYWDDFTSGPPPFERVGRTAVVTVHGAIDQRGGWWWDGYDSIGARFAEALADRQTDAVALRFDSPGGVCAGCFGAVDAMLAVKEASGKPVLAYADERAYSAAYALACVADQIWLPASGGVGSVGVIAQYVDVSKAYEQMGIRVAVVASGTRKTDSHPAVPLTDAAIERLRADVMDLAGLFFGIVERARPLTVEQIRAYQAGTFMGQKAVDAQLADAVGTFEEARKAIENMASKTSGARSASAQETDSMPNEAKAPVADPKASEAPAEPTITVREHEAALAALRTGHEATVKGLQATIAEQSGQLEAFRTEKAVAEKAAAKAKSEAEEAKVDGYVGRKVGVTEATRGSWLASLRALGAEAFDALMASLPDGPVGERKVPEKGNEIRSTDAGADQRRASKYLALVEEKVKAGVERTDALTAELIEHPELLEN